MRLACQRSERIRASLLALTLVAGCLPSEPPSVAEPAETAEPFLSPALETRAESVASRIAQRGFAPTEDPMRAFLVERESMVHAAMLPTGKCQIVVALGSSALREISIRVFDSGGTAMASVRGPANAVALRYCPDLPGLHYVAFRALSGDGLLTAQRFEGPAGIEIDLGDLVEPLEDSVVHAEPQ